MKKIKICESLDTFYPNFDGPIQVVSNYAKELNKISECQVIVPSSGDKSYKDVQPYEVFRVRSIRAFLGYRLAQPATDKKLKRYLREQKFDIIHLHSPFSMAKFLIRYGKKHNVPVILTLHTKFDQDIARVTKFKPFQKIAMRSIMKRFEQADFVWTVNNATVQTLRDYGYKGEVGVVRNGTDMKYPEKAAELRADVLAKHGLDPQKELILIFIGRIVMYKNLGLICDALKIAKEKGLRFKMLVVGFGSDEEQFLEKAKACGLSGEFIFAGKVLDREALSGYYLAADLFLFPSTFDTASLVPIEAAAHKVPTLLVTGSSTAEGTEDGVNAFWAAENAAAYAAKIMDIAADRGKLKAVGEAAYREIYRSWSMAAEEIYQKYDKITDEFGKKRFDKSL
ncbi:glycosyl transferase [Clostridia bacterium]|nr:glycosyl transferase [Clostridia bacterium]